MSSTAAPIDFDERLRRAVLSDIQMRIGQFTASLRAPHGGAEQYCLALIRWLRAAGHDVVVYTRDIDDETRADLAAMGVPVQKLTLFLPNSPGERRGIGARLLFQALDLARVRRPLLSRSEERSANLDVMHVHRWQGFGAGVLRRRRLPIVHTVHDFSLLDTRTTLARGGGPLQTLPLLQRIRARAIRGALRGRHPVFIFPGDRTRTQHERFGLVPPPEDALVIRHGWELDDRLPPSPPNAEDDLRVLFLGALSEAKGIPLLLEAWGDGVPGARLAVAGRGPLDDLVGAAAARVHSIEALGWVGGASRTSALRSASILVLPSIWPETFSLVSAEALLAGRPVLATERSRPELLSKSDSVVTPHSAAALRAALESLLNNRDRLLELQLSAAVSAGRFNVTRHVESLTHTYQEAMRRHRSHDPSAPVAGSGPG